MDQVNTRKLLSSYFLYECGRSMYFVIITWYLFQWTQDAMYTGLFVSFGFLPGLFSNIIFGVLVDRYNRKKLAVIAGAVSVASLTLLGGAFFLEWISPWLLILTHMVLQTTGSLFRPSLQALVAEVFLPEDLPRIFSLSGSATISGSLAGAAMGGVFSSLMSAPVSITIVVMFYAAAFTAVAKLHYTSTIESRKTCREPFISELRSGFRYLNDHSFLYGLFMMMMLGQLTFHMTLGFLSVYTSDYLEKNAFVYGTLDVTFSVGGIAAGVLGAWWWKRMKNNLAVFSLAVMACGLLLAGITQHVVMAFLGICLIGIGTSFVRSLLQSVQQIATAKEFHGRMASFRMLCNQSAVVITGPLFGFTASSIGANYVFLFLLIPVSLGIIWSAYQAKHPLFVEITTSKTA
ncbi:MFS transporter [Halobacillus sp. A1]|uniref:MFS transporter n=1 Tax=Halobacillus sp. A1 TaxID=2880262 RepID=UPI0020A6B302|nr:MFS transporter [Halobacillus sp. A1]MCP3031811.1 MFS transporter [Halobacillus sp. A1]